jgi:uncharacterized protein (DUF1501 family)
MLPSQSSRRSFLRLSLAGGLCWAASRNRLAAEGASAPVSSASAKAAVLVFLEGGPSHIDTFDPKPGQDTGGPFKAIDTKIAGVQFSEHFAKLANVANRLTVIRSLTSPEGDHDRAQVLLHTGYQPTPALNYPAIGSVVARETAIEDADIPSFVSFGDTSGPGYLGQQFAPFVVGDVNNISPNLNLPDGLTEARVNRRLRAVQALNASFGSRVDATAAADFTRLAVRANRFRQSPALKTVDWAAEEPKTWEAYGGPSGDGNVARMFLAARRMLEHGAKFVEIRIGGWDTHADNFNQVAALAAPLDVALAAFLTDLAQRGLLEQTLVAMFGEFGRTPKINGDNGRDHWNDVFSAVLAGGGVRGGQTIGKSDAKGEAVAERPVKVADLHATILSAFGVDPARQYRTPDGRPIKLTNGGEIVREVFG